MKHIRRLSTLLTVSLVLSIVGCDDANELLNQHIKDGPIIYAAKIDSLSTQSGYYRFQVNPHCS